MYFVVSQFSERFEPSGWILNFPMVVPPHRAGRGNGAKQQTRKSTPRSFATAGRFAFQDTAARRRASCRSRQLQAQAIHRHSRPAACADTDSYLGSVANRTQTLCPYLCPSCVGCIGFIGLWFSEKR